MNFFCQYIFILKYQILHIKEKEDTLKTQSMSRAYSLKKRCYFVNQLIENEFFIVECL